MFSRVAFFKKKGRPKLDEELEPVSVVICARNEYDYLAELVPVLLSQDYPDYEIVIVNDCSDDETEDVAEYFSDGFSLQTLYYALMSFLIVAGLFYSYGFTYDKLLDREGEKDGSAYMLLHVFLIRSKRSVMVFSLLEGTLFPKALYLSPQ